MDIFKSKKLWIAVGGVIAVIVSHFFGVAEETVNQVVAIVIAAVLGQGLADFGKHAKQINGK